MTLLGKILDRPLNAIRSNDVWGAWAAGGDLPSSTSIAGVQVNRDTAQALSAVWACRNIIASTIASLPVDVKERRGGARMPVQNQPTWVDRPNAEQTSFGYLEQVLDSLLLDGTAYIYTPRDRLARVTELWCVHPSVVRPYRENGRVFYDINDPENGVRTQLPGGEGGRMFHIPAYAAPGSLKGAPPLEVARSMIGAGLAAQEFSARFFGQGMNMSGVIEAPDALEIEQARELKQSFAKAAGGLKNSHLPAVLTGGATWKPMTMTAEQAQFIETRRFTKEDICSFFLVPPHLIGLVEKTTSWGAGIEDQNIAFVTYTLRQWIERIEQAHTRYLLWDEPGQFYKINVDGLLRGKTKERYEAHAIARQWGWHNADEIRALEDEPPLPNGEGQGYIIPANFTAAGAPTGGTA